MAGTFWSRQGLIEDAGTVVSPGSATYIYVRSALLSTKQRLVEALRDAQSPIWIIEEAREGRFDDFDGWSATPIMDLIATCKANGLSDIAARAREGEFDSTREEAVEWFKDNRHLVFK